MDLEKRIEAFYQLGQVIQTLPDEKLELWCSMARAENGWFTQDNVKLSLEGISSFLRKEVLKEWTDRYKLSHVNPKKIATIMAGNIPLVGFHDFLSVLISGHNLLMKVSSKDAQLFKVIVQELVSIEPGFKEKITLADGPMKGFDAVIATGSDNSARYFEYYFGKYPSIIRKNRTSCAVLTGKESADDLQALGHDVFSYFGLGCRNVSKLFVPAGYEFQTILDNWSSFDRVIDHHKFNNNYDYQKAILLVNQQAHLDTGYLLLSESDKLVSPISVLYYETYTSEDDVINKIIANRSKLQCIVGKEAFCTVPFGKAQYPTVADYADDIDTLTFLTHLH